MSSWVLHQWCRATKQGSTLRTHYSICLSRASVMARLLLDYSYYPSTHALKENWFIVWLRYGRRRYTLFSWLLLDILLVSQTSYKQVSKWLAISSNGENKDNVTALYTSYLRFTFGTNSMHTFPCPNLCCSNSRSKTAVGTTHHVQIALASSSPFRRIHAGVIWLPISSSGCVSSTLRNLI